MTNKQVETEAPEKCTPSVGEQLKSARLAQGKELHVVANTLHLDLATVVAIEADDQPNLPATIFVQGYIQNYAHLLGMPAEPLLVLYKQHAPTEPELELRVPKSKGKLVRSDKVMRFTQRRSYLLPSVIFLALILAGITWWLWPQLFSSQSAASGVEEHVMLMPGDGGIPALNTTVITTVETIKLPEVLVAKNKPEPIEEAVMSAIVETAESLPQVVEVVPDKVMANKMPDKLVIRSAKDSWVEIVDAEKKRLMYRLLRGGERREIEGVAPFNVLLGYAHDVELSINGEVFHITPFIVKDSARFRVERP